MENWLGSSLNYRYCTGLGQSENPTLVLWSKYLCAPRPSASRLGIVSIRGARGGGEVQTEVLGKEEWKWKWKCIWTSEQTWAYIAPAHR